MQHALISSIFTLHTRERGIAENTWYQYGTIYNKPLSQKLSTLRKTLHIHRMHGGSTQKQHEQAGTVWGQPYRHKREKKLGFHEEMSLACLNNFTNWQETGAQCSDIKMSYLALLVNRCLPRRPYSHWEWWKELGWLGHSRLHCFYQKPQGLWHTVYNSFTGWSTLHKGEFPWCDQKALASETEPILFLPHSPLVLQVK